VELSGWDAANICAKAIAYAATLCAAGGVFFLAYCRGLLQEPQRIRIRRLICVLIIMSAVASVARIPLLAGSMSGDFAGMFDGAFARMILGAGEGRATGARLAGLALAALAAARSPRLQAPGVLGAIIASMSFAWVGHIHALPGTLPAVLVCLHLLCAAFWLGALAPLLLVAGNHGPQTALIAARFGKSAQVVVGVLIVAGAGVLWILILHATDFWSSDYARLVAIKLFAVAFLLGLAALNRLYLTPRLSMGDGGAVRLLRRSIKAEMLMGGLILLITAAFTTITGPPR